MMIGYWKLGEVKRRFQRKQFHPVIHGKIFTIALHVVCSCDVSRVNMRSDGVSVVCRFSPFSIFPNFRGLRHCTEMLDTVEQNLVFLYPTLVYQFSY